MNRGALADAGRVLLNEADVTAGIEANEAKLAAQVDTNVGVVTALTPYIGYAAAASIAVRMRSEPSASEPIANSV